MPIPTPAGRPAPRVTAVPNRLPGRLHVVVLLVGLIMALAPASAGETAPDGVWPLSPDPDVVAAFDPPAEPWGAGHRGVDLRGHVGQPVRAALPGTVRFAGTLAGRGVMVVDHGEARTTYEPVAASVAVGTVVAAGDVIGTLTSTMSHCFPAACLHWGLIRNSDDVYLDPLGLVGARPVRLLPLWRDEPVGVPGSPLGPAARPGTPYAGWRPLVRLWEVSGRL